MSNPHPAIAQIERYQFQPVEGEPLGKIIGTRYPADVEAALMAMPDKQAFIRQAVAEKLARDGR